MAYEIALPKGNAATISLDINDAAGDPLNLTGSTVTFHVYDSDENEIITKTGTITNPPGTDGLASVDFIASDTSSLDSGEYVYETRVTDGSGNPSTVRVSKFFIVSVKNQADLMNLRTILGDTDSTNYILTDAEHYYFLFSTTSLLKAGVSAARAIQAKYADLADTSIESVSVSYSNKSNQYASLAEDLERKLTSDSVPMPSVFGTSKSDMEDVQSDSDIPNKKFVLDRFSNPPYYDSISGLKEE